MKYIGLNLSRIKVLWNLAQTNSYVNKFFFNSYAYHKVNCLATYYSCYLVLAWKCSGLKPKVHSVTFKCVQFKMPRDFRCGPFTPFRNEINTIVQKEVVFFTRKY